MQTARPQDLLIINELLLIPDIVIDNEMKRVDNTIVSQSISYVINKNNQLKNIPNHEFVFTKKGEKYASIGSLRTYLNKILKEAGQGVIRDVYNKLHPKELVAKGPPIDPRLIIGEIEQVSLIKYNVDKTLSFKKWGIYIEKDDPKPYPFMIVENPDGTKHKYDMYRYIAHLPNFTRLTNEYKLPTVDHINRNIYDNQARTFRYCTFTQNAWNKCNLGTSCIHGVAKSGNGKKWVVTLLGNGVLQICQTWFTLFATYPPITTNITTNKNMFSNNACQSRLISTIPDIALVNEFIIEVFDLIQTSNIENELYEITERTTMIDKTTIPKSHYASRRLMSQLYNAAPDKFKVTASYDVEYIPALIVDLYKLRINGEYTHTNMLAVPPPKNTVADYLVKKKESPCDILNKFEKYIEGSDDGEDTMKRYDVKIVDGLKRIVVTNVPRTKHPGWSKFVRFEGDESRKDIEIVSPMTIYRCLRKVGSS
jgi:hypothetical protein